MASLSVHKTFVTLVVLKVIAPPCNGQGYSLLTTESPDKIFGSRLVGGLLTRLTGQDFLSCVRECMTRKRCRSLNYLGQMQLCELNYEVAKTNGVFNLTNKAGSVYTEISLWNKGIAEPCSNDECPKNKQCFVEDGKPICNISDCGPLDSTTNMIVNLDQGFGIFAKANYSCKEGYEYEGGKTRRSCQKNGNWEPLAIKCGIICGPGHYRRSLTKCDKCGRGTYKNETGPSPCQTCSIGQYQDETGQTKCKLCLSQADFGNTSSTDNTSYCGVPPTRPHTNVTVKTFDNNKYCAAEYTCQGGYNENPFGNTSVIICDTDGNWPELSFNCFLDGENMRAVHENASGLFNIQNNEIIYRDMDFDNGDWIVIQQRVDQDEDKFNTSWEKYRNGFGSLLNSGNFWMGNENLKILTENQPHQLRALYWNSQNVQRLMTKFDKFSVETDHYCFMTTKHSNRWLFDGTCFSTYDRDSNNGIGKECARDTATGWWFFGYRHNANHTEYCKTDLNPNFYRRYHKSRMLIKLIT